MLFLHIINTQNTNSGYELKAGHDLSLLGCYDPEDDSTTNLYKVTVSIDYSTESNIPDLKI